MVSRLLPNRTSNSAHISVLQWIQSANMVAQVSLRSTGRQRTAAPLGMPSLRPLIQRCRRLPRSASSGKARADIHRGDADDIPDPRDVALISLVDACQILPDLFPDQDTRRFALRIEQLRKMDLIGREVAGTIAS